MNAAPIPRMSADDRRELVLRAATRAFARGGYHGTSTDAVAKEAGVSQPYVVRIFGTKLELFLEVFARASQQIRSAFDEVLAAGFEPDDEEVWERLGSAYTDLMADRDFLQVLMHGFSAGDVPEIGAQGRAGMGEIFQTLMTTGCEPEKARDFIAQGMLLNVMMSMHAPEHAGDGDTLGVLTTCAFGEALPLAAAAGAGHATS